MAEDDLIKRLRATRDDYAEELVWHRFLIDAYTGTGGFAGKVKQPATSYLGWAAQAYADDVVKDVGGVDVNSYLDRYPREDETKFERRRAVAHYPNYVEAVADGLLSFVLKRPLHRDKTPPGIVDWMANADGTGKSWDRIFEDVIVPRSALLGYTPCLVDAPRAPGPEQVTRAQSEAQGVRPKAIPLFPANLLDWQCDDSGVFEWAKLRLDYTRRPEPLGPKVREERYQIWERDKVTIYVVSKAEGEQERVGPKEEISHDLGRVPLVIFRHKPCPDDPVRGSGMVDGIAPEVRRLFNLLSELDEHLRQQVFALLQVPFTGKTPPSELIGGTDNAVGLPAESKHEYKFLAPPGTVAETYEKRIEKTVEEIYRVARVDYDKGGKQVSSGVSKAYEFEQTNRRLGDFSKQLAHAEVEVYKVLAPILGVSESAVESATVTAPTDFRVEDLATEIKNALDAISLDLTATAEMWLKKRAVEKLLPNLPESEREVIFQELEKERDAQLQARALADEGDQGEEDEDNLDDAA